MRKIDKQKVILTLLLSSSTMLMPSSVTSNNVTEISKVGINEILNKDIIEEQPEIVPPIMINGYEYKGEFPPYRNDAPWLASFSRPHVDYLPRAYHEAIFFNNQDTFTEFVTRFKGVLKKWASEARELDLKTSNELRDFFSEKLNEFYLMNQDYFKEKYPDLTERQYRLLMAMNLSHGNFEFNTQTRTTKDLLELIGLKEGDCSELADLVASLADIQGIHGIFLGLGWDYQSSIGQFVSGHQAFYADGLWIDAEINMAIKMNVEDIIELTPSDRFKHLIDNHSFIGFYNWFINPEVRQDQLSKNQDGGTIAFFYYYYIEGLRQGNSNAMSYFPISILNSKGATGIHLADKPHPEEIVEKTNTNDFELIPNNFAIDYWEKELLRTLDETDSSKDYKDIAIESNLVNSIASLIRYYTNSEIEEDKTKLKELINRSFIEFDQILSAKGVNQGIVKGWGRPDQFDAFQDGSVNPEFTKYSYHTFELSFAILNVLHSIYQIDGISDDTKNRAEKYTNQIYEIMNSWNSVYSVENGKSFYGYSEFSRDNKPVFNISGSAISAYLMHYNITKDPISLKKVNELLAYYLDYIKLDMTKGGYIWPYDLSTQRVEDVMHSMMSSRGLIHAAREGLLTNFHNDMIESAISSFWSGNASKPYLYINNSLTNSKENLSAGINFAQLYSSLNVSDYLWEYARSSLETSLLSSSENELGKKVMELQLLGLLFEKQPKGNVYGSLAFAANGQVKTEGEFVPQINPLKTKGNARTGNMNNMVNIPYFEIFEGDKLVLDLPDTGDLSGDSLISLIYRSSAPGKITIIDDKGNKIVKNFDSTIEDTESKWIRNTIKLDKTKLSKDDRFLSIELTGPIDVYKIEYSMFKN